MAEDQFVDKLASKQTHISSLCEVSQPTKPAMQETAIGVPRK